MKFGEILKQLAAIGINRGRMRVRCGGLTTCQELGLIDQQRPKSRLQALGSVNKACFMPIDRHRHVAIVFPVRT